MNEKEEFQPPEKFVPKDVPDVIEGNTFSVDISKVKESFAWFVNMADFLKTTDLTCKDCGKFPCYRYPYPNQKIGFCYVPNLEVELKLVMKNLWK